MTRGDEHRAGGSPAVAHHAIYRVLGSLFLPPTDERMASVVVAVPELLHVTEPLEGMAGYRSWLRLLRRLEALDDDDLHRMGSEYTNLFLSGSRAFAVQPYESAHVRISEYDVATISASVESCYRRSGVELAASGELPDHIAIELEYCAYLCHQEGEAERDDDLVRWRRLRVAFLTAHLLRWVPSFERSLAAVMPETIYLEVARTGIAVAQDDLVLSEALGIPEHAPT
jgi:TorA maturation chaperone TorD